MSRRVLALLLIGCAALLSACGGGDSSVTTVTGGGLNSLNQSPEVSVPFVQTANNIPVTVDSGPGGGFSLGEANILYATVTVCSPSNPGKCVSIDHVMVDTGSMGLRVLASKVASLGLQNDPLTTQYLGNSQECYAFVIGGLWGPNALAYVGLGQQTTTQAIAIQLIQDDTNNPLFAPPKDCTDASSGGVLTTAGAIGANGILGIGSVIPDCGLLCASGNYGTSYIQYYSCPLNASNMNQCSPGAVPQNFQVANPLAWLPNGFNNGLVLNLPAVTGLGAAKAHGELIFGVNTQTNNQVPAAASKIYLGTTPSAAAYLSVNTLYNGQTIANSYLDTGTNGLFFYDSAITPCQSQFPSWYCPSKAYKGNAVLSDGDVHVPLNHQTVAFEVDSANGFFQTLNAAFGQLAGTTGPPGTSASTTVPYFAWGLPFFYGRKVYLSIWDPQSGQTPWYAF